MTNQSFNLVFIYNLLIHFPKLVSNKSYAPDKRHQREES